MPVANRLRDPQRDRWLRNTRVFVAEKQFVGCNGLEVTDEVRVTIAAQACVLLIGLRQDVYPNVSEVLVYPSSYFAQASDGLIVSQSHRLGEAHAQHRGPVVLAWDSARHGGYDPRDGRNLVYHEFAHKLDFLDGLADGTPVFDDRAAFERWVDVMTRHYEALCDAAERGKATLLDKYGATNPAEFFAVATECFFEKPDQLHKRHSDLYAVLRDFYKQDPAAW